MFRVFNLLTLIVLCACGGGGTGENTPTPVPQPPDEQTPKTPTEAAEGLLDVYADPIVFTDLGSVPNSGSATYEGFAYGDLENVDDEITDSLIGALDLRVNFATSSLSGEIADLEDEKRHPLKGSINLTNGTVDRTGDPGSDSTIGITFNGTLQDSNANTLVLSGRLEGDFLGQSHRGIGGELLGSVYVDGERQNIDGGFIAER